MVAPAARETAFGQRLKQAYLHRSMSQHDLEKAIGVSQGTVSRYISGDREPTGKLLAAIVEALGVSLGWLVRGDGAPGYAEPWASPVPAGPIEARKAPSSSRRRASAGAAGPAAPATQDEFPNREAVIIALGDRLDPRVRTLLLRVTGPAYEALDFRGWLAKAKEIRDMVEEAEREYEGESAIRPKGAPASRPPPTKRTR